MDYTNFEMSLDSEIWTPLDQEAIDAMEAFFIGSIADLKNSGAYANMKQLRKSYAAAKKLAKTDPKAAIPELQKVRAGLVDLQSVVSSLPNDSVGMKIFNFILRDIVGSVILRAIVIASNGKIPVSVVRGLNNGIFGANIGMAMETPKRFAAKITRMIAKVDIVITRCKHADTSAFDELESEPAAESSFESFLANL